MIYQTIVFHSNLEPNCEVIYTYHNCTLLRAVEIFKDNCPNENAAILVFHDGKWVFKGYLVDGDVI